MQHEKDNREPHILIWKVVNILLNKKGGHQAV